MRNLKISFPISILPIVACLIANGQDRASIEKKLTSQYALTKTTADRSDIVTAGAIIVLQKDNLLMADATTANPYQNTYKEGKITQNALGKLAGFGSRIPGVQKQGATTRTFVTGEKFWMTKIEVKDNGVAVEVFTDAINDIRYRAVLMFPFQKGTVPPADQVEKAVGEVFKVAPQEDAKADGQQQQQAPAERAPAQPAQAQQAMAPIAPPPPPADAAPAPIPPPPPPADEPAAPPKTISLGQTKDTVVANFGQPTKIAKVGTKEIYYYPDLKVTFVAGKVTDVQ